MSLLFQDNSLIYPDHFECCFLPSRALAIPNIVVLFEKLTYILLTLPFEFSIKIMVDAELNLTALLSIDQHSKYNFQASYVAS